MVLEYWYVNDMLVSNRATRDWLAMQEFSAGREVEMHLAPRDESGQWVLPLNDPMEQ